MKKVILEILKYIGIFTLSVGIAFGILVLAAMIPKDKIDKNIKESVPFFKENQGIERYKFGKEYTYIHYYADSIIFNIIYGMDPEKPVESVLWSKYYETFKMDINRDFITAVEKNKEPNQQYLRYWHGSVAILRPLLTVLNVNQIFVLNKIILWGLAIVLFVILFIKDKKLSIIYLISMIMTVFYIVPMCFEYSWAYHIMFIVAIIAILTEKTKGDSWLSKLFFITGIATCYFDFLTTEIITVFVPLLLVLAIRKKENRLGTFKGTLWLVIKVSILWLIGYAAMWLAKWCLAAVILDINPIPYVKDNLLQRVYGMHGFMVKGKLSDYGIKKNFWTTYPLSMINGNVPRIWLLAGTITTIALIFDWNNLKGKWFSLIMIAISTMPYARYYVLTSHSTTHFFFTFRSQMITIIALGLVVTECFNYNLVNKIWNKIKKRRW